MCRYLHTLTVSNGKINKVKIRIINLIPGIVLNLFDRPIIESLLSRKIMISTRSELSNKIGSVLSLTDFFVSAYTFYSFMMNARA